MKSIQEEDKPSNTESNYSILKIGIDLNMYPDEDTQIDKWINLCEFIEFSLLQNGNGFVADDDYDGEKDEIISAYRKENNLDTLTFSVIDREAILHEIRQYIEQHIDNITLHVD